MVLLRKRQTCQAEMCEKAPNFGYPGGSRTHCSLHKMESMKLLQKKQQCRGKGCSTRPNYGFYGTGNTHCAKHKELGMESGRKRAKRKQELEGATTGQGGGNRNRNSVEVPPATFHAAAGSPSGREEAAYADADIDQKLELGIELDPAEPVEDEGSFAAGGTSPSAHDLASIASIMINMVKRSI
ncbi:unnamed protein product [Chrysoparadoxa australica]